MGGSGQGGVPLGERRRPGEPSPHPDQPTQPARHCWLTLGAPDGLPGARPALLLEWRRTDPTGWEGRVVYLAQVRAGRWSLIDEWLPGDLLSGTP